MPPHRQAVIVVCHGNSISKISDSNKYFFTQKINNIKYKLVLGLIFIAFNAKAHIPSNDHFQLKIARQIVDLKVNSANIIELKNEITVCYNDSTSAAELIRLSKLWMEAMLHHDSTLLNELMTPEYRLQRWDGKVLAYRALWLDNLFHHIKIINWEQSDFIAQVYGDVAIVTSHYGWTGTGFDKEFDSKGYLTDVWVRHNNHWQVVSRTNGVFEGSKTLFKK
jgi:ketosteroid isomerase-like protein